MTKTYNPLTLKLAWNLAAPRSWVASILPAVFGVLFCYIEGYSLAGWKALPLIVACVLLQASVNTLNDYMDFIKGTDGVDDQLEEKDAVLLYGGIRPKSALMLGIGYLVVGALLGILCCIGSGFLPIAIGLVGVVVIALYSCGPHPISYLPVGELISGGVMGGLIPLGICACADGQLHLKALAGSLPLIIGIAMIMLSNNGCDIEKDTAAGRKTFPVVVGRSTALMTYRVFLILWAILLVVEPVILLGKLGVVCVVFFVLLAFRPFATLWKLALEPSGRIKQMQTIAKANLKGNGAYCLTMIVFVCVTMLLP